MSSPPEILDEAVSVRIRNLAGSELAKFDNIPSDVGELKQRIAEYNGMPAALQKLMREDGFAVCEDGEALERNGQSFILVRDETPLWYWDSDNPARSQLDIEASVVKCPRLRTDYANVLTREPVVAGLHYFEFHLHHYGDEQWCGLTPDKDMAGTEHSKAVPSKTGWMYYTGRGTGALEALGHHLKQLEFVGRSDSHVIGMLVDCDGGAVAFDLNGKIQGACEIPKNTPLWLLTHVDTTRDHVELRKPSLEDAPPAHFDALKDALLDVSGGTRMTRSY